MITKKKRKKSSFILLLMFCFLLTLSNINIVNAEALPDVMSGSSTIADIVMSYYALAGSAVANSDWVNDLYSELGNSFGTIQSFVNDGYMTMNSSGQWEYTTEFAQAIESTSVYSRLGLDTIFNVSTEEALTAGGYAATGGVTLAGAAAGVASTGVLPLVGGVTAAYWGGIGIGNLINHLVDKYKKNIATQTAINAKQNVINNINYGERMYTLQTGSGDEFWYIAPENCIILAYLQSGSASQVQPVLVNTNNESKVFRYYYNNNVSVEPSGRNTVRQRNIGYGAAGYNAYFDGMIRTTQENHANLANQYINDPSLIPSIKSPDLIGENGNLQTQNNDGNITVPDMKPQIDPGTQAGKPLTLNDWLNFANGVQNNNNNTAPSGTPDNAALFDTILDSIRTALPGNVPNPNPNPDATPTPTPVPKPDYDPDNPDQPEYDPKETEGPDDVTNGDPWTTPDLLDRFPFCLPRDVFRCFEKLNVNERMAPSISWHFVTPLGIHFDFDLDLEDYEGVANILRTLELIAFIIGLALATRNLIGR